MTVTFESDLKNTFVESLLECAVIKDSQIRQSIVAGLSRHIRETCTRQATDRGDVFHIVGRCLDFEGGVEELVDTLLFFEGLSVGMKRVYELVPSFLKCPGLVVPNEHLAKLLLILMDVLTRTELVRKCYRNSLPPMHALQDEPKAATSMIKRLLDLQPLMRPHPVFKFVNRISMEAPDLKDALDGWKADVMRSNPEIKDETLDPESPLLYMLAKIERHIEPGMDKEGRRYSIKFYL